MIISYGRPGILAKIKTITVNTKESVMPGLRLGVLCLGKLLVLGAHTLLCLIQKDSKLEEAWSSNSGSLYGQISLIHTTQLR